MKTKMTELLGIEYPIMQGGMQWLGVPGLAAAVSNAGGLGTINASCYPDPDDFRKAIRRTKELTGRPFAVNISVLPDIASGEAAVQNIRIAGEEGAPVVETAGRSPNELRPHITRAGMIHIHKCTSFRHALSAQNCGADIVTVVGYEAAGHPSPHEIGSFTLFNEVSKGLTIPVLGGGGVADGAGLAAALALGCAGVVMGTRFVASAECLIHPNFKQAIVEADETATLTCQRNIKNMCRYYKNAQSFKAVEAEKNGGGLEEMLPIVSGSLGRQCYQSGDTDGSCFPVGVCASLVKDVKPAGEIIEGIVREAELILKNLSSR